MYKTVYSMSYEGLNYCCSYFWALLLKFPILWGKMISLIRHISLHNNPKLTVSLSWKIWKLSNLGSLEKLACGDISAKWHCYALRFATLSKRNVQWCLDLNRWTFYYVGVCLIMAVCNRLIFYCIWKYTTTYTKRYRNPNR